MDIVSLVLGILPGLETREHDILKPLMLVRLNAETKRIGLVLSDAEVDGFLEVSLKIAIAEEDHLARGLLLANAAVKGS